MTCPSSMCFVKIEFCAIFVPSTALSAMFAVATVFAAIWSLVIWLSSICLVKILFDAIFVPSIVLSAIAVPVTEFIANSLALIELSAISVEETEFAANSELVTWSAPILAVVTAPVAK